MRHKLTRETIDLIFEQATEQVDYLLGLYRVAFPDFDDLVAVNGYPAISKETALYICGKAIDFDKAHHPRVMNGGLWMNNGFSSADTESMPSWMVDTSACPVVRKAVVA